MSERLDLGDKRAVTPDFSDDLRARLPQLRDVPGCPTGSDDAIIEMSAAPAHTACPNPYLREWVEQHRTTDDDRADPGPFAADSQAGKTSLVYKAHGYPTKVPHEAIMRLILHYTKPGDIVLDGFCGTGMTGVAAQMCGTAGAELRTTIELEMGKVEWGPRRAVLQDLGPSATFIAAGLNLPVDADAFDRASKEMLDRFDDEYGWMYETELEDGRDGADRLHGLVRGHDLSRIAGRAVVFFDAAFDARSGKVSDAVRLPVLRCRSSRRRRSSDGFATVRTLAGDAIERVEYRAGRDALARSAASKGCKPFDDADRAVLDRVAQVAASSVSRRRRCRSTHMAHGSRLAPKGFTHVDHLWGDRALTALDRPLALGDGAIDAASTRRALALLGRAGLLGLLVDEPLQRRTATSRR